MSKDYDRQQEVTSGPIELFNSALSHYMIHVHCTRVKITWHFEGYEMKDIFYYSCNIYKLWVLLCYLRVPFINLRHPRDFTSHTSRRVTLLYLYIDMYMYYFGCLVFRGFVFIRWAHARDSLRDDRKYVKVSRPIRRKGTPSRCIVTELKRGKEEHKYNCPTTSLQVDRSGNLTFILSPHSAKQSWISYALGTPQIYLFPYAKIKSCLSF